MNYLQEQTVKLKAEIRNIAANSGRYRAETITNGLDEWLAELAELRAEASTKGILQGDRIVQAPAELDANGSGA